MTAHHHKQPVLLLVIALLLLLVLQAEADGLLVPSSGVVSNNQTGAAARCLPGQAAALLRLKRSFVTTKVSNMTFASWRAGTDCCGWAGVLCGSHGGSNVTSIDLGGRGLQSATLDPAIFNLTSLRYLNLAHNDFRMSKLPSTGFERLTHLTHLNLSNANFSGIIPADSIGRLTNLVSMDLSATTCWLYDDDSAGGYFYWICRNDNNQSTSGVTALNLESLIAKLSNLRELRLDYVDLSGNGGSAKWCSALAKYTPNLRVLSLQFCSLSGPICGSFSALRSLAILDLRLNRLSGAVPAFFADMPSLRVLKLSDNNLQGQFPSIILQHTKLVTVDLTRNTGLSGNLPRFSAGSSLESLRLRRTNFSGEIPSSIGNLKSLKELDLAEAGIEDTGGRGFSGVAEPGFSIYFGPGFSGTIPSSIGKLTSLEWLALSGFGLVGSISPWIANLTSLTILRLYNSGLSGSIPSSVGELTKLKELTLSSSKFFGNIPSSISNLTQLDTLNLQSNNFSGTVELSLFMGLPNLSVLSLSNNNLFVVDGEDSSSLVYPRIKSVGLVSCGMEKLPKLLRHLGRSRTNWLDISQNRIRGTIPQWAWENWSGSHFHYLNLSHNYFTSFAGLEAFLPFSIDRFDLSSNMFEGPIPLPRNLNQGALELDYSNNTFSSMPLNFSTKTSIFKASRNNLSGSILASFCGVNDLEILDLSYNNLTGPIPSCLMEDTNKLRVINLKRNRLHGELSHNINESCSLEVLDFGDNEIRGKLPRSLAACSELVVFDIQNNQISDSFPCWMSTLGNLYILVLKSNGFFGQLGPSTAEDSCDFPSTMILDLASNNFSGTLTEEWLTNLMSMKGQVPLEALPDLTTQSHSDDTRRYEVTNELTYKGSDLIMETVFRILWFLDVSNNDFQGSIPAAIGDLVQLNVLNMSHNSLTGPIPNLGNLTQLEALDLSSNGLSGEIPRELASLNFLTTLDLSNNKLVGSIPESPHFMTFSNSSFLGNSGLCGPPLSKECINGTTQNVVISFQEELCGRYVVPLFWNWIWCRVCYCYSSDMGNTH
ncbi:unnamed protein product [Urochloa decumbens]|uniref:Leucine-rich repeat-containing N-terminal plant-type domain-containing protein n=1 Tax=Urochloa decumbens TaxID=240449 RepID=A0ABC9ASG6_9POAL